MTMKGEIDVVSEVDLAAEQAVLNRQVSLSRDRIVAGVWGSRGVRGREWHIDPLDGQLISPMGFLSFAHPSYSLTTADSRRYP